MSKGLISFVSVSKKKKQRTKSVTISHFLCEIREGDTEKWNMPGDEADRFHCWPTYRTAEAGPFPSVETILTHTKAGILQNSCSLSYWISSPVIISKPVIRSGLSIARKHLPGPLIGQTGYTARLPTLPIGSLQSCKDRGDLEGFEHNRQTIYWIEERSLIEDFPMTKILIFYQGYPKCVKWYSFLKLS